MEHYTNSKYSKKAQQLAELISVKNAQYGNSFQESAKILDILYPNGVKANDYENMMTIVRILDKIFRIANGDKGDESAWDDIAGYALLKASENSAD